MSRKPYVRPVSKTSWFLRNAQYKSYMLHEISSVFVAIYTVLLIIALYRLAAGPEAWQSWLDLMSNPIFVIFHLIALAFAIIHTMSWFKAVPQAMRIQRGEEIVDGKLIIGAHYGVLGVVSLFFLVLAGVA